MRISRYIFERQRARLPCLSDLIYIKTPERYHIPIDIIGNDPKTMAKYLIRVEIYRRCILLQKRERERTFIFEILSIMRHNS